MAKFLNRLFDPMRRQGDTLASALVNTEAPVQAPVAPANRSGRVSLALQGGGSFGAFTWGVLDRLLERGDVALDTVSGASAGAINAAVLASGFSNGGAIGAREALERFWRRASGAALSSAVHDAIAFSSRVFSPYQANPFDLSPLRSLLNHEIDFDRIRTAPPFRLMIGATRVADGQLRLFGTAALTPEVLLASACLPLLNQAVEIEGDDYWDGGYAANPPLIPLIESSDTQNILVVQIIPSRGMQHPRTVKDIARRLDHITFSSSLTHDLETIAMMKVIAGPDMAHDHKIVACDVGIISAEDAFPGLNEADALNLDWSFLCALRDAGRSAADAWSERTGDATIDGYERPSPAAQSAANPSRYVG